MDAIASDGTISASRSAPIGIVTWQNAPGASRPVCSVLSVASSWAVTGRSRVVEIGGAGAISVSLAPNVYFDSRSVSVAGIPALSRGASSSDTSARSSIGYFWRIVASTAPGCRYWPCTTVRDCTTPPIGAVTRDSLRSSWATATCSLAASMSAFAVITAVCFSSTSSPATTPGASFCAATRRSYASSADFSVATALLSAACACSTAMR